MLRPMFLAKRTNGQTDELGQIFPFYVNGYDFSISFGEPVSGIFSFTYCSFADVLSLVFLATLGQLGSIQKYRVGADTDGASTYHLMK